MKLNSLKFIVTGITGFAMCVFVTACNNESGNNSTTNDTNTSTSATTPVNPSDSGTGTTTPATTTTTKKKRGRASVKMTTEANTTAKMEKDKMGYYNYTEVLPGYKGGQTALDTYINDNIEYPQQAIDNSVEGTVTVQFAIDENGNVSNVKTIGNKLGYGLDEEAVRVISKMPKWIPGQVKGKNVKTWRTLPITYKLEES
jgi:periplasmic protein TonB